jgi:uncharacterized protein (DUF1810 family)
VAAVDRFVQAQDDPNAGWEAALGELRAGRKRSHWIWYVFPQLSGLGMSATSRRFGIAGRDEASEYLLHPILRSRLLSGMSTVADQLQHGTSLATLMGSRLDALKLMSSVTLFASVARTMSAADDEELSRVADVGEKVLLLAEAQGFVPCQHTLQHLREQPLSGARPGVDR